MGRDSSPPPDLLSLIFVLKGDVKLELINLFCLYPYHNLPVGFELTTTCSLKGNCQAYVNLFLAQIVDPFLFCALTFSFFSLFFVSETCARLSWPSCQLLSAR